MRREQEELRARKRSGWFACRHARDRNAASSSSGVISLLTAQPRKASVLRVQANLLLIMKLVFTLVVVPMTAVEEGNSWKGVAV